jgi:hypothetical protein
MYPAKISLIIKREIKTFHDKQKLKAFITTKLALQKILNRVLQIEEEHKCSQENVEKNKSH